MCPKVLLKTIFISEIMELVLKASENQPPFLQPSNAVPS